MKLLLGQRIKLHSPAGVHVPRSQRTYPFVCKGTVTKRTQQKATKTSLDKTPRQLTQGYNILLDKPHPELASMNTSSPISCWKKELQLLSVELHEHSYHLSRIAAALERVAEGLDLLSANKIVYDRGQSPNDGGTPHSD